MPLSPLEVKVTADTSVAEAKLKGFGQTVDDTGKKVRFGAGNTRMLVQQLSQVGQQAAATGQPLQALAVQAADIGMAFGTMGTIVGTLAGVAVPTLIAAFTGGAEASKAFEEAISNAEDALSETSEIARILAGDFDDLSKRYGSLAAALSGLAAAEGEISLRKLSDASRDLNAELTALYDGNAWLNVSRAEDLANGLRLSTKESRYFAQAMKDLGQASSLDEQYALVKGMREEFVRAVGPVSAMSAEQFQFYTHLVDSERVMGLLIDRAADLAVEVSGSAASADSLARSMMEALNAYNQLQAAQSKQYSGRGGAPSDFEGGPQYMQELGYKSIDDLIAEYEKRMAAQEGHQKRSVASAKAYQDALTEVDRMGAQERLGLIGGALGDLSSLMSTNNAKLFKIGKAAAIAEATVSGYQAAVDAWAKGMKIGGPPVAAAFTAASLAKTGALIAGIASQQVGGGGGSVGSGGGTVSTAGAQGPLEVRLQGVTADSLFTGASVSSLFDMLNAEAGDRGVRVIYA